MQRHRLDTSIIVRVLADLLHDHWHFASPDTALDDETLELCEVAERLMLGDARPGDTFALGRRLVSLGSAGILRLLGEVARVDDRTPHRGVLSYGLRKPNVAIVDAARAERAANKRWRAGRKERETYARVQNVRLETRCSLDAAFAFVAEARDGLDGDLRGHMGRQSLTIRTHPRQSCAAVKAAFHRQNKARVSGKPDIAPSGLLPGRRTFLLTERLPKPGRPKKG